MRIWAVALLIPACLQAWAMPSFGKDERCTPGVDCLCDRLSGDPRVVLCEDFENPGYDSAGSNAAWNARYGNYVIGQCGGVGSAQEGTAKSSCFNVVKEGACDVSGEGDCVFQGNQSLGVKFDEGWTHGHFGGRDFPPMTTFGVTYVVKFSGNFVRGGGPGFKPTEWNRDTQSFIWGQDVSSSWAAVTSKGSPGSGTPKGSLNWETRMFFWPNPTPSVASATVTKGFIFGDDAGVMYWRPWESDFPGGKFNWPLDTWACLRTKWTNITSTSSRVQQWWQGPNDAGETLVVDISNLNTSGAVDDLRLNAIRFNNYFNGLQDSTAACGYGSTNAGPCTYAGVPRAYRYEDNYVVTNGDPVSCADLGFGPDGGTTPPASPPPAPLLLP